MEREKGAGELKIWSAGCSSGEEPLYHWHHDPEFQGAVNRSWEAKILATDISEHVLGQAEALVYTKVR
jgi:chemotaxis protein methyltransferase CheR